ncbi:hypothetical protein Mame01_07100 [Microbispora amethystogenes]|nr:hypothetical protein Mame01_07100 [Microbispora amethystogenes]
MHAKATAGSFSRGSCWGGSGGSGDGVEITSPCRLGSAPLGQYWSRHGEGPAVTLTRRRDPPLIRLCQRNRNSAQCWVPSAKVTFSRLHWPDQALSVFQTYVY